MEGLNKINKAIDYIEAHLDGSIDLKKAAQCALQSEYHLSRLFTQLFDISLSEYIRRRRLTLAAYELQNNKIRVIDVALKYGYESADAFGRAFKKLHGITPSDAKVQGAPLVAFPKLAVNIVIGGEAGIDYRIEKTSDIKVQGKGFQIHVGKELTEIPTAWQTLSESGALGLIGESMPKSLNHLNGLLGVYGPGADGSKDSYGYFVGGRSHLSDADLADHDLSQLILPGGKWLVFKNLHQARKKLYDEWIPTLGYALDDRPYIECIFDPYLPEANELWVPIL